MYLGTLDHANNQSLLQAMGITHVVSVGESMANDEGRPTQVTVLHVAQVMDDGLDTRRPHFLDVLAFVKQARLAGGKVLVHCRHGVNQSATVVIAYVLAHMDWSLDDAYLYVRSRHLHVILQPHLLFFWDLMGWERFLVQATGPSAYAHGPPMPRPTPILVVRSMLPHPHAKSTVLVTGPSAPFVHSRSYVLDRPQLSACLPRTPPDNLHLKN